MKHIGDGMEIRFGKGFDEFSKKGYFSVPRALFRDSSVSTGGKIVYTALLDYAWVVEIAGFQQQKDEVNPSQQTIANNVGMTRQSVNKYIQELQRLKLIEVKRRGQGKSSIYTLNMLPHRGARNTKRR